MEIIKRELNNPIYDRNTLRFFLDLVTSTYTDVTIKAMLTIAKTIKTKKKTIAGGLVQQKFKISRFINKEYVNIFEIHQASTKNMHISVDDVRIQSHPVPYKYVVTSNVYDIERRAIILQKQLDKMLTSRQRELFIANFDLSSANQTAIDSPYYYTLWLTKRLSDELEEKARRRAASGQSTDSAVDDFSRFSTAAALGAAVPPPPGANVLPTQVAYEDSVNVPLIMPGLEETIAQPNNNPFFEYYYLSNSGAI